MPRELPPRPNIDHLKNQAKELLKAHSARDPSVCERLRSLNRFKGKSDAEILAADLPLQDAQFVLAMEYGFSGWNELRHAVERREMGGTTMNDAGRLNMIGDLDLLNAASIQSLMAEMGRDDLAAVLRSLPEKARERFLGNLSVRRRAEAGKDAGKGGGAAAEAAAGRALELARKGLVEGRYSLGTEEEAWREKAGSRDAAIAREFSAGPTSRKTPAELLRLFLLLTGKGRAEGVIALDRIVEGQVDDPLTRLGLEMAVDRVALERPGDFAAAMQAGKKELMAEYEKRLDLIILGTGGIGTGMNPSLMEEQAKPLI